MKAERLQDVASGSRAAGPELLTGAEWTGGQIRHHDGVAGGEYDESVLREYAYFDRVIRRYLRRLRRDGFHRVLDFGCGTGRVTLLALQVGLSVVAIDISLGMVKRTQEKLAPRLRARAHFVVADGAHLPFRNESFDAVVCAGVLHHMEDVDAGIREQGRVLRRRGRTFAGEPSADPSRFAWLFNRIADGVFRLANAGMVTFGLAPRFIPARRSPGERALATSAMASILREVGIHCACRWYIHHSLVNRYVPLSTPFFVVLNAVWRGRGGSIVILTGERRHDGLP